MSCHIVVKINIVISNVATAFFKKNSISQQFEEATGSMPDPSLPIPNQLEIALRKIKENIRIILN